MPYKQRYLVCSHCNAEFLASKGKVHAHKKGLPVFCSSVCRIAKNTMDRIASGKRTKYSLRECGPCPTCGKMFNSRYDKKYCSMSCYTSSPEFQARIRSQAKKANEASVKQRGLTPLPKQRPQPCQYCGKMFTKKPRAKTKFCSHKCYRLYMADRFDRWIASPQTISLPNNYDEFLTSEELSCLVEGCNWKGHHLSAHMNFAHGVTAEEFKRAAGFNLSTGVISMPLHDVLCSRDHIHQAHFPDGVAGTVHPKVTKYKSKEGLEHLKKGIADSVSKRVIGEKICQNCGEVFTRKGAEWNKKFCSIQCRSQYSKKTEKDRINIKVNCPTCGKKTKLSAAQNLRMQKGLKTGYCSIVCRQKANSPKGKDSHASWKNSKHSHNQPTAPDAEQPRG